MLAEGHDGYYRQCAVPVRTPFACTCVFVSVWRSVARGASSDGALIARRCLGIVPAPHPPQPLPSGAISTQMHRVVDYILSHAAPSGWIGPDDSALGGDMYWGRFDILLALEQ